VGEPTVQTDRPLRADARRNRARILAAARELFASERPEVGMDDLAHHAGVGVGTLYRHFPDKQALMAELVRERFGIFNERLREAVLADGGDPFEALAETMRFNAGSVAEDAATRFAFMSGGEAVWAQVAPEKEEFLRLAAVLVERAHAAGVLRADFSAEEIPMIMCGLCAIIDQRSRAWDWRRHLEITLAGMRAGQ
jgi:AcrR family transcriptional regulator